MKRSFINKLACPFDKHDLTIKIIRQVQDEIMEGILSCDHCQRYYPIVQGIPIMTPDEHRAASLEIPLLEKWGENVIEKEDLVRFRLNDRTFPE